MTTKQQILAYFGLEPRVPARNAVLYAVPLVGTGILVGTSLGLLFAPKRGQDLRSDIGHRAGELAGDWRHRVSRIAHRVRPGSNGEIELESLSQEQLHDRAKELGIDGHDTMSREELVDAVSSSQS